jgi:hypothetical protein
LYVDPKKGKVSTADWVRRWLKGQAHLKPSRLERYAGIVREHVLPRWSDAQLIDITHADIQSWVT